MNARELQALIAQGESLTIEFKSDRGPLSDGDLLEAVACLANGQGGTLVVGVEDDGKVTGLHAIHRTRPERLAALVAGRTVPPLTVDAWFAPSPQGTVAVLRVPAARQPTSTSAGRLVSRPLHPHGRPACRPLYAYDLANWRAERGQIDLSALPVPGAAWAALDPLEFARLRRMVEENRGDAALLELPDQEIAQALGLVQIEGGESTPTLAGLLLVGKESALRDHIPAHEVAFQVLHGTDVAVNEFRRWPLLRLHEWLMQAIEVRNEEQELMVNGFRVGVPRYDRHGIREAVNNALIHRDFTRLGAVHVQMHDDYALVTNPGGFVAGVQVSNLLVAAPRPRNPLLADAFKRAGLVERTGRGVSIIYSGQLRNGRPTPSYAHSTEVNVTVTLDSRPADLDFVLLSIQANRRLGRTPGVDDLLALWELWRVGAVDAPALAPLLQKDRAQAAGVLIELARIGLLQADGSIYRLSADLRKPDQAQLDPDAAILALARRQGRITRREAVAATGLTDEQTRYRLRKLTQRGDLEQIGIGRGAYYRTPKTGKNGE
ncbi:MAG: putative DNA binding domain-containing protein [Ardenticatenia bacterium]|nr:putative DNA binding domain-containing protein [Ardenticatenia bacterium]